MTKINAFQQKFYMQIYESKWSARCAIINLQRKAITCNAMNAENEQFDSSPGFVMMTENKIYAISRIRSTHKENRT
jgi:hypothetical protein